MITSCSVFHCWDYLHIQMFIRVRNVTKIITSIGKTCTYKELRYPRNYEMYFIHNNWCQQILLGNVKSMLYTLKTFMWNKNIMWYISLHIFSPFDYCYSESAWLSDPSCKDVYKFCRLAGPARLCSYPFYQENCCSSCQTYQHRKTKEKP